MKKIMYIFLSVLVCGCAGNPPAWWNPSGRYTTQIPNNTLLQQPTAISQKSVTTTSPEESFTPEETLFEEMNLLPPTDESMEGAVDTLQPSILDE